jgi:hypothetical protein
MRRHMLSTLAEVVQDADWWPAILETIAGGGSLLDVGKSLSVEYGVFRRWIASDEARELAYQHATKFRDEAKRERAIRAVGRVVDQDVRSLFGPAIDPQTGEPIPGTTVMKPIHELTDDEAGAIASIEFDGHTVSKIRMNDRLRASAIQLGVADSDAAPLKPAEVDLDELARAIELRRGREALRDASANAVEAQVI